MKYGKWIFSLAVTSLAFLSVAVSQGKVGFRNDLAKVESFFANPSSRGNRVELLFLQQADAGSIMPNAHNPGCYTLTLTDLHKNILFFSDQPKRTTGLLTINAYMKMWAHDPIKPNVAMQAFSVTRDSIKEINTAAVLSNPRYNPKIQTMTYTACLMKDKKPEVMAQMSLRSINLFIDPIHQWPP